MRFVMALAFFVVSLGTSWAQDQKMRMVKLAEDTYVMEHPAGSSNSAFFITRDGVLVFDADIRSADQTLAAIRKLTDKKVRYLISSHPAGDHATGGWHFREDRPVFITTKGQMRALNMEEVQEFEERKASNDPRFAAYKGKELVGPDMGFEGSLTIHFGGLTFQLTAEGAGHSVSDLTAYVPQRRVMLMGDLLNTELHPGTGDFFFSQVQGWIDILDRIMRRHPGVDTYVSGHGPVHVGKGIQDLEEQQRYFVVMRDEVSKMIRSGKDAGAD